MVGIVAAPLLPFAGLFVVPLTVVWLGMPIEALLFAILLDSFLVPGGVAPLWVSLTLYTVLWIPVSIYVRYTTTL